MVLGRCTDHRWATNINIFNRISIAAVRLGNGCSKRIEINHNQIDGSNIMIAHDGVIGAAAA